MADIQRKLDGAIIYSDETKHLFFPDDDLRDRKFGRLTVIDFAYKRKKHYYYKCKCECGNECIKQRGYLLYDYFNCGHPSCGCWRLESQDEYRKKTYDYHKKMPEYAIWQGMKRRCNNPSDKAYERYGGRGIRVCNRWNGEHDFINFLTDMGSRPSPKHTLDRVDNNGDYCPENCRWVTAREQNRNKRNNIHITYKGETKIFVDWCRELDLPYYNAISMYKRGKRTFEEIVEYYKSK